MTFEDTIVAIATPPGSGGIGIIRISGSRAQEVARLLFKPPRDIQHYATHHLYHGEIVAPASGRVLDEVLIALMKKPSSYTGEDVLEIYCHGGYLILQTILQEIVKTGCRPALPGEFTKRAFLNDRLDLSQAEAVSDMITAKTEKGLEIALSHLKGNLSATIDGICRRVITVLAFIESSIDLNDDETSQGINNNTRGMVTSISMVIGEIENMLATYEQGRCFRNGVNVVIAGRPNVGKSSLLNALLGENRAIVTAIPGTTRDFIEEFVNIRGVPVKLTDTAGIRKPGDIIEEEGIERVREKLTSADLVIILLDGSEPLTGEDREVIAACKDRPILVVLNKSDLPPRMDIEELKGLIPAAVDILSLSAKFGYGLFLLKDSLHSTATKGEPDISSTVMIANIRHKTAMEKAVYFLTQARDSIMSDAPGELIAVDIRDALSCLGEITHPVTNEDILEEIFANFCVGK